MNSKTISINGTDYSPFSAYPYTIQRTLDESLDTAQITLNGMAEGSPFKPFSEVVLGSDAWYLADDEVTEIHGRSLYNHTLTLIEPTKVLERFLIGGKAFTNPQVKDYLTNPIKAITSRWDMTSAVREENSTLYITSSAVTPQTTGTYTLPSLYAASGGMLTFYVAGVGQYYSALGVDNFEILDSTNLQEHIQESTDRWTYTEVYSGSGDEYVDAYQTFSVNLTKPGVYKFIYFTWNSSITSSTWAASDHQLCLDIYVYEADSTKTDYTVANVVDHLLDDIEPLRYNVFTNSSGDATAFTAIDTQRFVLDSDVVSDHSDVFNGKAPEFRFDAGRSLWDCLQEVGKFIHAIPRLKDDFETITFDFLGGTTEADFSDGIRIGQVESYSASDYTESLTTLFSNLADFDDNNGEMYEPGPFLSSTLRASEDSVRIEEGTGFIKTAFPIARLDSLTVYYNSTAYDITKYVFEAEEYATLSSYNGVYPVSKTYALSYSLGGNTIEGLWFKAESAFLSALTSRYAITNILNAVTGNNLSDYNDYVNSLLFQVKYVPMVDGFIKAHKIASDCDLPLSLAFNQSASKLSAKAFGESLRGQLAMLGTTSIKKNYLYSDLSKLAKPGEVYGSDYIGQVTAQVNRDYVLVEYGMATGYNQLGQYLNVENDVRMYEIPKEHDRYIILEDFINVTTDAQTISRTGTAIPIGYQNLMGAIVNSLSGTSTRIAVADSAIIKTYDASGNHLIDSKYGAIIPVYSSGIGNSLSFIVQGNSNVSLGSMATEIDGTEYNYQSDVRFSDSVYSEAKYMTFTLAYNTYTDADDSFYRSLPLLESNPTYVGLAEASILLDKDSADNLRLAYQVHFVSDDGVIIGDNMARKLFLADATYGTTTLKMVTRDKRISELTGEADPDASVVHTTASSYITVARDGYDVTVTSSDSTTAAHKSWALYLVRNSKEYFLCGKNTTDNINEITFQLYHKGV